jgi:hypothetical protein
MKELFNTLNTLNIPLNNDTTKFIEKYVNENGGIDRFSEEINKEKIRTSSNYANNSLLDQQPYAHIRPAPQPPIRSFKNEKNSTKNLGNEERYAAAPPPVPPPPLPNDLIELTNPRNDLLKSIEGFNKTLKPVQNTSNKISDISLVDRLKDELDKMAKYLSNYNLF